MRSNFSSISRRKAGERENEFEMTEGKGHPNRPSYHAKRRKLRVYFQKIGSALLGRRGTSKGGTGLGPSSLGPATSFSSTMLDDENVGVQDERMREEEEVRNGNE